MQSPPLPSCSNPLLAGVCSCVSWLWWLWLTAGLSSSGSSTGTVALTTLALKSFCPGFGAFSVDTRYCHITVVHQKW